MLQTTFRAILILNAPKKNLSATVTSVHTVRSKQYEDQKRNIIFPLCATSINL